MDLVAINNSGLLGKSYYWENRGTLGITQDTLEHVGVSDDRVYVDRDLIAPLCQADCAFQSRGWRLFLKEGYRPSALYELAYQISLRRSGQATTDRLFNMKDMPHADGRAVDVVLVEATTERQLYMRRKEDEPDAFFVDYYKKNDRDPIGRRYQQLQEYLIGIMQDHGFRLGTKLEYWHFNYRPDEPRNYPLG